MPIHAFSRYGGARRRMALMRDVFPWTATAAARPRARPRAAAFAPWSMPGCSAPATGWCSPAASTYGFRGATNTLRLLQVGEDGKAEGGGYWGEL
ncbi:MAG: hypothetical protein U1F20_01630 [Lysobacterales bacterium]